jgi:hypothetical protein
MKFMMMMMMISPFGQFGLWAPSSGAGDVFTRTAYVDTMSFQHHVAAAVHGQHGRLLPRDAADLRVMCVTPVQEGANIMSRQLCMANVADFCRETQLI